jgi:ssDNA-binding Zn-finger/Zn-ribbon topoisomerase 1
MQLGHSNIDTLSNPSSDSQVSSSTANQTKKKLVEHRKQEIELASEKLEATKIRKSNILPDGKFWKKTKANDKIVYKCPLCDKGNMIFM